MIVSLPSRGIGVAVLVAGLMLAGCSSDSDVPQTEASAPNGGTQINTDTGSGGEFPDINTVPNQRPTSTFQDLAMAPEGLPGAQSGTQYGEALVGRPTSSAEPPAPPPPPEPPQPELAPIPEPGIQTEQSDAAPAPAQSADAYAAPAETPVASNEPIATPEIAEPQPMEPMAEAVPAPTAPRGQTIEGTTAEAAAPEDEPEPAAMASAPEQPAAPVSPPQPEPSPEGTQQAGLPASGATAPEAYGITAPQSAPTASYGGADDAPAAPAASPGFGGYGQPQYTGQPVGLIYFRDGSSSLSEDDRGVLKEIADLQHTYGGVVNVIGHASTGSAEGTDDQQGNQRISEERAVAVAQELMTYGVAQNAIRAAGVGASQPLYAEGMPGGDAANRRVEVYLSAY